MSPLWRDEVRIWLAPGEVRLRRLRRGLRPACVADATHAVDGAPDWRRALSVLEACLAAPAWQGAATRVAISNRLARFAVAPWSDALTREAEQLAHARICLADIYGNTGADWRVCLSDAAPGDARVACALPDELLTRLRSLFEARQAPVLSIQPALIDAFNRCRSVLPASACWFVNIEPSVLVAVRLAPRGWESVYSARIGNDWATELLRLRMFAKLTARDSADARIYVDAPERLRRAAPHDPDIEWLGASDESAHGEPDAREAPSLPT